MSPIQALPEWAALVVAVLVLLGAALTLTGTLGLLRLRNFYQRVHAPTLGTTLGTGSILIASIVCFSVLQSRLAVHEILIAVFVTATTPVTLMLLVRAALYRDRQEGNPDVPQRPSDPSEASLPVVEGAGRDPDQGSSPAGRS